MARHSRSALLAHSICQAKRPDWWEHRSNGERKYYLSSFPADTAIKGVARAIKARWICEQAQQQLKEELGLDHFEGRSWTGLHRHFLMRLCLPANTKARAGGAEERVSGLPIQSRMPDIRQTIIDRILRPPPHQCPHCGVSLSVTHLKLLPKVGSTFSVAGSWPRQMDESGEVDVTAVVAGCEAAEVFEATDASLDLIAMLVDVGVVRDRDLAVTL